MFQIMIAVYTDGQAKMKLIFKPVIGNLLDFFNPKYLISGNYPSIHGTEKASFTSFDIPG